MDDPVSRPLIHEDGFGRKDTGDDHEFKLVRGWKGVLWWRRIGKAAGSMNQRAAGLGDVAIDMVREGRSFGCYCKGWQISISV
jgi:hypothetical protein